MSFLEEFDEFKSLPLHIGVTYKFFQMFKVTAASEQEGTPLPPKMSWGNKSSTEISEEMYSHSREFLKHQRAALRSGSPTRGTCARLMWFWTQKILEAGLFTAEIRAEILRWLDECIVIVVE